MGLDMQLIAEDSFNPSVKDSSVGSYLSDRESIGKQILALLPIDERTSFKGDGHYQWVELSIIIANWRNAWPLHRWFVEHVQRGKDDCKQAHVGNDRLESLYNSLTKINANEYDEAFAAELIPSDFYDDQYYAMIRRSIPIIESALVLRGQWTIHYRSSW